MGEMIKVYKILVGKPEGKRWGHNIRKNLREIGCESEDKLNVAQDRDQLRTVVNKVMNLRVP
jgi:hypothetical protein